MRAVRRRHVRWAATLATFAVLAAACAADDDGDSFDLTDGADEARTDDERELAPAGAFEPHDNIQPSTALNCIIALRGWYPTPVESLRRGFASSAASGSSGVPAARLASEPMQGEIAWTAFDFAPRGWARCDGQLLAVSDHPALFSLLGDRFGGDGTRTFALPDVRGRTIVHEGQGDGLTDRPLGSSFGAAREAANSVDHTHTFDSTAYSIAGSNASHDNMQPSIVLNCIIAVHNASWPQRALRRQYEDTWFGEIKWVPYTFAPRGWEFCDGQIRDVDDDDPLWWLLGDRFGGDGITTYALPDARGRTFVHAGTGNELATRELGDTFGVESVALTEDHLPSHDHGWWPPSDESRTSFTGGGRSHENMQPSLVLNCIISTSGSYSSRSLRSGPAAASASGEPTARFSPTGSIAEVTWIPYDFEPKGWEFCDGERLAINENTAAFSLIGYHFGALDPDTFALPDLRGRTYVHVGNGPDINGAAWGIGNSRGSESVTLDLAEMRSHQES